MGLTKTAPDHISDCLIVKTKHYCGTIRNALFQILKCLDVYTYMIYDYININIKPVIFYVYTYHDHICMLAFPHGPCVGVLCGSVVFSSLPRKKKLSGMIHTMGIVYWVYINVYNTTGCLTRHVTISLAFSASQLFILREDKGLKNCREGHESKFLQFMVTSGFPLRRISLDPMISESSGFEGGSIILVLPGFM